MLPLIAAGLLIDATTVAERPGDMDIVSQTLSVRPDIAARRFEVEQRIVLRARGGVLRRLTFSANAMTVDRATAGDVPVAVGTDPAGRSIVRPRPLPPGGRLTVRLRYHGAPGRGATFLPGAVYTGYWACEWMFCRQDDPADKARFAIRIEVPRGQAALSIGGERRASPLPGGMVAYRWRSDRPYSAYLFAFAAGSLARGRIAGPTPLAFYAVGMDEAQARAHLRDTAAMAAFMRDRAGLPLPARRYAALLVPGSAAQEAATYSTVGAEELAAPIGTADHDWALAHELAHQWWGNLVTCADWRELWLNEGMAVFMTAAWKQHRYGEAAYQEELDRWRRRVDRAAAAGWDRRLAYSGTYPSLGARRAIQYSKAALFVAELRVRLGERPFWAGLRRYTRAHAGGTVTGTDLRRAMERAGGMPLGALFDRWVGDGD